MNEIHQFKHSEVIQAELQDGSAGSRENKGYFVERMKRKSLFARANKKEVWDQAFLDGYGGLETDIFLRMIIFGLAIRQFLLPMSHF